MVKKWARGASAGGPVNQAWLMAAGMKLKKVEALRSRMQGLTDEEMKDTSAKLKQQAQEGESLDKLLPEAFALVREAALRVAGMEPYPVQVLAGIALHEGCMAEVATGDGKAVDAATKVPTPGGWKKAGDIRVGDFLFGRNGKPVKVTGVFPQGEKEVYRVTLEDGRAVDCCEDHLWGVYDGYASGTLTTLPTKSLVAGGVTLRRGFHYHLPVSEAVEYPAKELKPDPYVLGASLGGSCKNGGFELPSLAAGEARNIPDEYKTASIAQRKALVQGMMDMDGDIDEDDFSIRYCTASGQLRDDFMEVLYSLGCSCKCLYDKGTARHQVKINVPNEVKEEFFRLGRKRSIAARAKQFRKEQDYGRIAIVDIEKTGRMAEQVCFTVDNEEHLFLVGDYVVTHNTLVAAMPSYLNALAGKGVHVVTVNDYLARRDAQSMGRIHEFLGLTVGAVTGSSTANQRKDAYACDITYVTNAQLGFDWLRDNMVQQGQDTVLRGLEFAIIDEADSILIDEARTPLIISGEGRDVSRLCMACDVLAKQMGRGSGEFNKVDALMGERAEETGDFIVHEKEKTISLTGQGVEKAEKFFRLGHYGDEKNQDIHHALDLALRANYLMERDKDYIVQDGKVQIVDEFTGRVMPDRQYSDGMHQAVEAKEGVEVRRITRTIASTTYQSFFNKYAKKAGMTGTAWTARQEFRQIYRMRTVVIPTNRPMVRVDHDDRVFMTKEEKYAGVLEEALTAHANGQPVLIGTVSVEASEELSALLRREGITHQVLNARQDKREAEIVAHAGQHGTVTIATNMAGRGTDIVLDEEARAAGGLKVIGTERHESRRIDNQLRGRAGRQGDPGESVFCVAMDDRVTRLYAPERLLEALNAPDTAEDKTVQKMLRKAVCRAQKNIEDEYYHLRKSVLEYGHVNDRICEAVYSGRNGLLAGEGCSTQMQSLIRAYLKNLSRRDTDEIIAQLQEKVGLTDRQKEEISKARRKLPAMQEAVSEQYNARKGETGEAFAGLERFSMLRAVDIGWKEQLAALEYLQQAAGYNAFAQDEPKTVYANEAYRLYGRMKTMVQEESIDILFNTKVAGAKAGEGDVHEP